MHELTAERSLDLFVLFSSVSATVGTAGQGNYAAANAYLDALVRLRLAEGLPAVGIAWGPWAGIGMAGGLSDAARRAWARHGVAELGAEDGARVLRRLLSSEGVVAVYPTAAAASARPEAVADADEKNMESPRDPAELLELVRGHAMTALGRTATVSDRTPLRDLGLDSMMAVELRNALSAELGVRLPATLLFDHPTVAAVSEEIARRGARSARNGGDPRRAAREQAEQRPVTRTSEQLTSSVYPTEPPATPSNYNVLQLTEREPGATPEDYADAIAIIGMGCRYPGDVGGPADLWHLLTTETDAVTEVPAHRWDADAYFDPDPDAEGKTYTRWGGFVDGVEEFDAGFFDISVGEARMLDPQQRLLLETSWEALEHAGYPASRLEGSRTGVFVGLMSNDYAERMARADLAPNAWFGTGNLSSVASGRLSYFFGANGPSLTVDTACSSSLVTVHTAVRSLRSGECDLALAGGATVVLTPSLDIYFARARGLAADGRCKSFDARADGVVWSDGAGVLVLKRLADARRDGDRVLGLVRGSAVNSDGRSQGLSAPNGPAQERVVRAALADAAVEAAEIDYVETHGTGTALGDPIEVNALASVLGDGRTEAAPLWIGSVKSNLGHTQAAAGIANIIKVIESMRHERIPASLHFRSGNPHIDWDSVAVRVVAEERSWRRSGRPRRAGVSAFGISGTNAHVVIEEAPPVLEAHPVDHSGPHLLVLSAKSADALRELAARYRDFVAAHPEIGLADVCVGRAGSYAFRRAGCDHVRYGGTGARGARQRRLRDDRERVGRRSGRVGCRGRPGPPVCEWSRDRLGRGLFRSIAASCGPADLPVPAQKALARARVAAGCRTVVAHPADRPGDVRRTPAARRADRTCGMAVHSAQRHRRRVARNVGRHAAAAGDAVRGHHRRIGAGHARSRLGRIRCAIRPRRRHVDRGRETRCRRSSFVRSTR